VTDRQILRVIGANVKDARSKAGLTQECLAELVGIHWQTVSLIENGRVPCSIVIFAKITQALQTSANRLLDGVPELDRKKVFEVKKAKARKRRAKSA